MHTIQQNGFDFDEFSRFFKSRDNTLPTVEILGLDNMVTNWVRRCECGCIIYGEPRTGKTRAIHYLEDSLHKRYGSGLATFEWDCTYHDGKANTDKFFYQEMIRTLGLPSPRRSESAQELKRRVLNSMLVAASGTKYRMVLLFVDEAQLLTERDYLFLIDLYNNLDRQNAMLITFLVGQPELIKIRAAFRRDGKSQITCRFMNSATEFHGISNLNSMNLLVKEINTTLNYFVDGKRLNITETMFPASLAAGTTLDDYGTVVWDAFQTVNMDKNITKTDVPMHYFISSMLECFRRHGIITGGSGMLPDIYDFIKCIEASEYQNRGCAAA